MRVTSCPKCLAPLLVRGAIGDPRPRCAKCEAAALAALVPFAVQVAA